MGIFLGSFSNHKKSLADKGKFRKYKIASAFITLSGTISEELYFGSFSIKSKSNLSSLKKFRNKD